MPGSGHAVTLDQLIALNDEMAALIRAGVPLERGLIDAGRDLQGRLGAIVGGVGEQLQLGERLPEALAGSNRGIPEIYRAVVEAGIRSGRLSKALEGMAGIARNYAEMRRTIGIALVYPMIVCYIAYGLGLVFLLQIAPRFVRAFQVFGLAPLKTLDWLVGRGESVAYWGPIPPILLLILVAVWFRSGRSAALDPGFFSQAMGRIPVIGTMIRYFRAANFAELLALLIDHQVPLDQALELAGDASGDRSFQASTRALARSIRSGQDGSSVAPADVKAIPPLLSWVLTGGRGRGELSASLEHVASTYRRKAENRGQLLRSLLPAFLMISIGAGAVIAYALFLFIPLTRLWNELAIPVNQ
jgi:type II secretory pathway component PulF